MKHMLVLLAAGTFLLTGCEEQSTQAALEQMCSIPPDVTDDPKDIGPYLAERIQNKEVINLLERLDTGEALHPILKKHGIAPETCDLLTALAAKPSP